MSDIRFQITGRDARDVAARFGALLEGELGQQPEVQEKAGVVTMTTPARLYVGPYKTLQDKLGRIIGFAAWEARSGTTMMVREATDAAGAGQRLDQSTATALIELVRK